MHAGFWHEEDTGRWLSRSMDDLQPSSPSGAGAEAPPVVVTVRPTTDQPQRRPAPRGFFGFAAEQRPILIDKLPELSSTNLAAMLGAMWQDLSDEERSLYDGEPSTTEAQQTPDRRPAQPRSRPTTSDVSWRSLYWETDSPLRPGTPDRLRSEQRSRSTRSPNRNRKSADGHGHKTPKELARRLRKELGMVGLHAVTEHHGTHPGLLQVAEKEMMLTQKGAPLHLVHFPSAPARAHRARMQQHKALQAMRLKVAKQKATDTERSQQLQRMPNMARRNGWTATARCRMARADGRDLIREANGSLFR